MNSVQMPAPQLGVPIGVFFATSLSVVTGSTFLITVLVMIQFGIELHVVGRDQHDGGLRTKCLVAVSEQRFASDSVQMAPSSPLTRALIYRRTLTHSFASGCGN